MTIRRDLFDDFHLHGASAPEWNQRYVQLSPGRMRSALVEASTPGLHVFRKWMSEQVVQQGCLPAGRVCFALAPEHAAGTPRMQGCEFRDDSLYVLRAGDEFILHRPRGMELLAATFDEEAFLRLWDEGCGPHARALLARRHLRAPRPAMRRLRRTLEALSGPAPRPGLAEATAPAQLVFDALRALVDDASGVVQGVGSASAGAIVARCHALVAAGEPPDIEGLCLRLKTSRRTLQNSFRQVADTTASDYLRGVRLHAVRVALLASPRARLSISQAAMDQGFAHFGRFTAQYKGLYGELPSDTARPAGDGGTRAAALGTPPTMALPRRRRSSMDRTSAS